MLRYYTQKEGKIEEGPEIIGIEESKNSFIDIQFMGSTPLLLALAESQLGFLIEDGSLRYIITLNQVAPLVIPYNEVKGRQSTTSILGNSKLIKQVIDEKLNIPWWEKKPVPNCLSVSTRKIAIGWKYKGMITLYDTNLSNPDKVTVTLTKAFSIGDYYYEIISIEFNTNRDCLAVAARRPLIPKDKREREISMQQQSEIKSQVEEIMVTECFLVSITDLELIQNKSLLPVRQLIDKGNIYGNINNVSVATLRNCIATVGNDRFIRIWDFNNGRYRQSVNTLFETDINDVSIHPFGIQLAIGANEGIRVLYVLEEEIRLAIEVSGRPCMAVQYSYGGQWLAAGFATQVFIIDSNTFETKYVVGPHRSLVTRLSWTPNDYYLTSSCKGGNTFCMEFSLSNTKSGYIKADYQASSESKQGPNKKYDIQKQNVQFTGSAYDEELDLLVMTRLDKIMEIVTGDTLHIQIKFEENVVPTCLHLCKESQVLLVGTSIGYIRAFLWPLPPKGQLETFLEYHDFKIHSAEVTGIKMSIDGKYVFSSSKDGTVGILKVVELWEGGETTMNSYAAERKKKLKRDLVAGGIKIKCVEPMDSLSLSYRNAYRDKLAKIDKLKDEQRSAEEMGAAKEQLIRKEMDKEISELKKLHVKALDEEHRLYRKLQEQYELDCKKAESEKMRLLEEHHKFLEDMDESHQKEQRAAFDLNNEKIALLEKQKVDFAGEIESIQKALKDQIVRIEGTYQTKYEELKLQHTEIIKKLKVDGIKFEEALEQSEQEYEKEIQNIKTDLENKVKIIRENNDEVKKGIELSEKDLKDTKKAMFEDKEQIHVKLEVVEELKNKKTSLEEKVNEVEEQLKQKEIIIHEKEKEIQNLRNANTHLENFRFVLDHKIISLQDEKVPMDMQKKNLEDQVKEMYQELEKESETYKYYTEDKESLKQRLENAKERIKLQAEEVHQAKRRLDNIQYDVGKFIKEPVEKWPPKLIKLYNEYFGKGALKLKMPLNYTLNKGSSLQIAFEEPKGKQLEESTRAREILITQKSWLENKLESVKSEHSKRDKEKAERIQKLQKQNTDLINDGNILQRDYDTLKCKVKQLEDKFKELTGISLTNVQDIDKEIKKFIHPTAKSFVQKGTMSLTEEGFTNSLKKSAAIPQKNASSILEYYNSMVKKGEEEKSGNINSLIGDMQKNKQVLEKQNVEMSKLQVLFYKFELFYRNELDNSWHIVRIKLKDIVKILYYLL